MDGGGEERMDGGGGGGVVVLKSVVLTPISTTATNNVNRKSVISELQTKWGELEKGFKGWVFEQPWPVQTAVVTATNATVGAVYGVLLGTLLNNFVPMETRWKAARGMAVMRGTGEGMIFAMRRIRGGKDDTKARAVAGFTSGFLYKMIENKPSSSLPEAITTGLFLALCHGLIHKAVYPSKPPVLDPDQQKVQGR